jgi:hypothetical protein
MDIDAAGPTKERGPKNSFGSTPTSSVVQEICWLVAIGLAAICARILWKQSEPSTWLMIYLSLCLGASAGALSTRATRPRPTRWKTDARAGDETQEGLAAWFLIASIGLVLATVWLHDDGRATMIGVGVALVAALAEALIAFGVPSIRNDRGDRADPRGRARRSSALSGLEHLGRYALDRAKHAGEMALVGKAGGDRSLGE